MVVEFKQLKEIENRINNAVILSNKNRNEEDRKFIVANIGQDLVKILTPLLREIAQSSKMSATQLQSLISAIKVEAPQVNVEQPKIEVSVPEVKVPEVNVRMPEIKLPKIVVPAPRVTVKAPEVNIPKEMEIKGLKGLIKSISDALKQKPKLEFNQDKPLQVILTDEKGKQYKALTTLVSGGGSRGVVTNRPLFDYSVGFEQLTITSPAIALASIPEKANKAVMTVEDATLRYRDDGTNPTSTVGLKVFVGGTIVLHGRDSIQKFRVIKQGSSNSEINVAYYERK